MKVQRRSVAEINIVPYIDVMLVLLIIFMITAPLLSQGVNVELPQAQAKSLSQQAPIIVSVNANGNYFLNTSPSETSISEENLRRQVSEILQKAKEEGQSRSVFVKGDKHVDYDKVMQAMVILQQAGAENIGLVTQTPSP